MPKRNIEFSLCAEKHTVYRGQHMLNITAVFKLVAESCFTLFWLKHTSEYAADEVVFTRTKLLAQQTSCVLLLKQSPAKRVQSYKRHVHLTKATPQVLSGIVTLKDFLVGGSAFEILPPLPK